MYKGLKKKYSREEYIKLALTKKENKCYFCMHNWRNYNINFTDQKDVAAVDYFKEMCRTCIYGKSARRDKKYWHRDNFKTLYDWEENIVQGEENA